MGIRAVGPLKEFRAIVVFIVLVLMSNRAQADVGIPMLALAWPLLWVLLIPIVLLEGAIARRTLALSWRASMRLSLGANLWSTIAGIPLAWGVLFGFEMLGGLVITAAGVKEPHWWMIPFLPLYLAWLPPVEQYCFVYLAAAALCVPFAFTSVWIETWYTTSLLPDTPREEIRKWSRLANWTTYGVLLVFFLIAAAALSLVEYQKMISHPNPGIRYIVH